MLRHSDAQIDYLVDLLSDENPGNRWKAAQALGRAEDPAAVEALLRALYDGDESVQRKAVWALGSIGDPRAIAPLRRRYAEVDESLRDLIDDAERLIQDRMYRPE
jgi:HEAT repeat protein